MLCGRGTVMDGGTFVLLGPQAVVEEGNCRPVLPFLRGINCMEGRRATPADQRVKLTVAYLPACACAQAIVLM